jgi:2-oxopent-4-enoate/cis-2-oxohex-4-enoate hydratase
MRAINRTKIAAELFQAQRQWSTVAPLTERYPEMTTEDAYEVQQHLACWYQEIGQTIIGRKIGVTSLAVQTMLGVHEPDFGFLTDAMRYQSGDTVSLAKARLIQPRAEGEIAFRLKRDLMGPNVTRDQVLEATECVAPCFEIVDSRIADWKIRIQDTVADNASCGIFVLGDRWTDPAGMALEEVRMEMFHNGKPAGSGAGSAVQGHPAEAVAWLVNTLGRFGVVLQKGQIVLSGALAPLVPVSPGDTFDLAMTGLGTASIRFDT